MRGLIFAASMLLGLPVAATAATVTRCTIDGDILGPSLVSWDSESRVAEITLDDHSVHKGRVTRTQDREPRGSVRAEGEVAQADNLLFTTIGARDETEFLVFPTATGSAIFGVGYDYVDGIRYLATSQGHWQARCD